jgi:hypothetical protein
MTRVSACSQSASSTARSPACASIRQHTSAYVSIRQHALMTRVSACSDIGSSTAVPRVFEDFCRRHLRVVVLGLTHKAQESAYVSIRQHTSAYVSMRLHTQLGLTLKAQESARPAPPALGAPRACAPFRIASRTGVSVKTPSSCRRGETLHA